MVRVALRNVTKKFGDFTAVNNVLLDIEDKEFVALLGPSGSGKTTTLRLVAGLETPTEGEIVIGNEVVNELPPKDRDIAMVFQNYALYPHLNVRDNIAVPLKVRKKSRREIDEEVRKVADMLQIKHLLDKKPKHLSGGEQQRVALARAIVRHPKVFLFDEPLSNLDAILRVATRGFLKRLQRDLGVTAIYVTHDQAEAMTMADRIAVYRNGKVQQCSTPSVLYDEPANRFVAEFVGSPPMNFIHGVVKREDEGLVFISGNIRATTHRKTIKDLRVGDETKMTLGIRPENIMLSNEERAGWNRGRIYIVEPLGATQYVTVDVGGQMLKVQTDPFFEAQVDAEVYCNFRKEKIYLFDPQTGERIP